jgi:peptide/nickel transport system permease protein
MSAYLARRVAYAVLTFFGITIVTFALIHSVPGDPITFYIGKSGTHGVPPAILQAIRHEYHLDESLVAQYGWWLRGIVTLDFGPSVIDHRPAMDRILEKLPNTFVLNFIAFALAALAGIPIGLWSASVTLPSPAAAGEGAAKRRVRAHLFERGSSVVFFLLYSLPSFWVALLLMQFFAVRHAWLPLFGMTSDDYLLMSTTARIADRIRHMILPSLALTYAQLAFYARFTKSALTEVIHQDFITTARAKGVSGPAVLWRHAFRNALLPLVTLLGLTIPYLLSGSVIIETMFQWDGVGHLYLQSLLSRDYPTVLALTVVTAVVTLFASVLSDVLYAIADPRVRVEGKR